MSAFEFPEEKTCPKCGGTFTKAELKSDYDPIVVVTCPHCSILLWRPGSDESSRLFVFDPEADAGGI
jgi:hypothetical protein